MSVIVDGKFWHRQLEEFTFQTVYRINILYMGRCVCQHVLHTGPRVGWRCCSVDEVSAGVVAPWTLCRLALMHGFPLLFVVPTKQILKFSSIVNFQAFSRIAFNI